MIRLEIDLDEIDYNALLERYYPQLAEELRREGGTFGAMLSNMGGTLAKGMIASLSRETKDALLCMLLNRNSDMIKTIAEQAAMSKGVSLQVTHVQATSGKK